MKQCVICHKSFDGWGNNPEPLSDGECCSKCNDERVLPLRFYLAGLNKDQLLVLPEEGIDYRIEDPKSDDEFLSQLQGFVKGYIELYPKQHSRFLFLVNEEGLLYGMRPNRLAERLFGIKAVGPVVVCPKGLMK